MKTKSINTRDEDISDQLLRLLEVINSLSIDNSLFLVIRVETCKYPHIILCPCDALEEEGDYSERVTE